MIGSADGGAERIRCLRRDGAERKEVAKHKDDAFAWNPSEGIAAFLPCMQIRGVHGVGLVGDTRVLCLLGCFWCVGGVFVVVFVLLCGWFVGVCDTPWVVACLLGFWGVGLWVVCVFAGGGVCSSLAASRGGGRLGLVVLPRVWWWFENSRACFVLLYKSFDCQWGGACAVWAWVPVGLIPSRF